MRGKITIIGAAVVIVLAAGLGVVAVMRTSGQYEVRVAMPNAIGVVEGTPVQVRGQDAGRVTEVKAQGNEALVAAVLDKSVAPLRAGTTIRVEWRSLLGERYLQIDPGPEGNPVLPSGAIVPAGSSQVVVEDLLETLDPETRSHLTSLVQQLDTALSGKNAQNLNETLRSAGPTVKALGALLNAVGQDGPAIRSLITNLHGVTQVLAERGPALSSTVEDLNRLTASVATQQKQLSDGLGELPSTLDAFQGALDAFPPATSELVPLLDDLRPAAARLPAVAANLNPVLTELRPTVADLKPTLQAVDPLLGKTPAFLDRGTSVVPKLQTTVERLSPAVAYLRPYTPEAAAFAAMWGNFWAAYDSRGHFAHVKLTFGSTAVNNQPNVTLPGQTVTPDRLPGENVGQPWTDANGSAPR